MTPCQHRVLFDNLVQDVTHLIDPAQDRVAIFPLCRACAGKSIRLGLATRTVPGEECVFIV